MCQETTYNTHNLRRFLGGEAGWPQGLAGEDVRCHPAGLGVGHRTDGTR